LTSNDEFLIDINGIDIKNKRNQTDAADINGSCWSGMVIGNDGYP